MSFLVKKVVVGALGSRAEKNAPKDPHYESYTNAKGKEKKRRREVPTGLSKRDARILKSVRKRAQRLDTGMNLCGLRVGWTFWLGIIPGAGDVANALLGYFLVIRPASKCEIPNLLRQRMVLNQAAASGVGLVPMAGDVLMAMIKPNSRNAWLLEEFLLSRLESTGSADAVAEQTVTKSKSKGFWSRKTGEPAQQPGEHATTTPVAPTASTSTAPPAARTPAATAPAAPAPAHQPTTTRRVK